jgi:hypothetical protein
MRIDSPPTPSDLVDATSRLFELAARKVRLIDRTWDVSRGAPVFTVAGRYTSRGWTEWTQGFQFGCQVLAFEATGEPELLEMARRNTRLFMSPHVTHAGVHDHGFNNLSTYGQLRRLMREGRVPHDEWELAFYELALKASGAVQAARWSAARDDSGQPLGYVYSFNGPHSLFIDTMRTLRILGVAHQLGHYLAGENDRRINLLGRSIAHALTTAKHVVFYGDSGHTYDVRGRTAHEATFNPNDGRFRSRATQQGYSPFSTWTRGLAWAMLGFAEQMEFLASLDDADVHGACGMYKADALAQIERAARATCDHYLNDVTAADGIPYWDDGAPRLAQWEGWRDRPADPFNDHEPVDSSAAAIAAQGLIRLGRYLGGGGDRYTQSGLAVARTLLSPPYLSEDEAHQGLLLHSVYHRPNGWDHVPPGRKVPCGESSMWGDYHLLELALLIRRLAGGRYYTFFDLPE